MLHSAMPVRFSAIYHPTSIQPDGTQDWNAIGIPSPEMPMARFTLPEQEQTARDIFEQVRKQVRRDNVFRDIRRESPAIPKPLLEKTIGERFVVLTEQDALNLARIFKRDKVAPNTAQRQLLVQRYLEDNQDRINPVAYGESPFKLQPGWRAGFLSLGKDILHNIGNPPRRLTPEEKANRTKLQEVIDWIARRY